MVSRAHAFLIVTAGVATLAALRAARAAAPQAHVEIGEARIIKSGPTRVEVEIGNARISKPRTRTDGGSQAGGGSGDPAAVPMRATFTVRVNGFEKLRVGRGDVVDVVRKNAGVLPGVGAPTITVADVSGGYAVQVQYPDSSRAISNAAATRAVESVDSRLKGRVTGMKVTRA